MKIIIEKDEHAMSESAMQIILGTMMQDKKVNVSLTSGSSPKNNVSNDGSLCKRQATI